MIDKTRKELLKERSDLYKQVASIDDSIRVIEAKTQKVLHEYFQLIDKRMMMADEHENMKCKDFLKLPEVIAIHNEMKEFEKNNPVTSPWSITKKTII